MMVQIDPRGLLPQPPPEQIYAGYGLGSTCDACDQPIDRTQVEYELTYPATVRAYHLHLHCVHHWEAAVVEMHPDADLTPSPPAAMVSGHTHRELAGLRIAPASETPDFPTSGIR